MSVLRNPKHEQIAQALWSGASAEDASRQAGYREGSPKSYAANARKRAQRHGIPKRVAELQEQDRKSREITLEYLTAKGEAAFERAEAETKHSAAAMAMIAASNYLAKLHGYLRDKVEIKDATFDGLSDEQVAAIVAAARDALGIPAPG